MLNGKLMSAIGVVLLLSACGEPQTAPVQSFSSQSTAALCVAHANADGTDLLAIEAELGVRGVLQCQTTYGSTSYVGERTAAMVGRTLYARSAAETVLQDGARPKDNKNCSDFASGGEAQRFFLANGGPHRDPYRLDGDGDGNACEWGKTLKSNAARYKPKPVRYTAPRQSTPTCHTGPRGGRYYYSASGNKVYGC